MLISQLSSCSFCLDLSVFLFNMDSFIYLVVETFWSGFPWTEVISGYVFLSSSLAPECQGYGRNSVFGGRVSGWTGESALPS